MLEATTLWELICKRADATPDAVFLTDETGRNVTFAGYKDLVERTAAGLHTQHGVKEGSIVCWQLPTWIEAAVMVSALSRLGAIQNPLVPIYRERECGFIVRQLKPQLVICPSTWRNFDYQAMHEGLAADSGVGFRVLTLDKTLPEGDPADLPAAPTTDGELPVRWYFYTSGTTSDPKGARHTDRSVIHGGIVNADGIGMTDTDTEVLIFPFTHIGGANIMCSALLCGARLALVEAFTDPNAVADFIKAERVTIVPGATPIHQAFLAVQKARADEGLFDTVKIFPSGGAPIPPALHYELKDAVGHGNGGIVSGYGLTEAPILTMNLWSDTDEHKANSEGRASRGVTLRLVKDDGTVAGPGEEGEIRAKGPQIMQGYADEAMNAYGFDEDGWFRTGDLGVVDADGYVTITGRLKDVIIRKGENVSALEVENTVYTHDAVAEVAVIGLPDPNTGERVCAVVVTATGAEPLGFDDMVAHCKAAGLMMQKIPEQLVFVDALPRNATGKVLKHELQAQFKA